MFSPIFVADTKITLVYNFVAPLKCIKDTESVDSKMLKTKISRPILSSKCAVCGSKTSKFIKEQEAKGWLSSVGLKTPLCKIPLLGDILF